MATLTKNWGTGTGSVTLTYGGQLDGTITVDSDPNNLTVDRSMTIDVKSSVGGITRTVTIVQKGKTLPYDSKVEYLQCDNGNQYIDTDIKITSSIKFDFDFETNTTNARFIFGGGSTTTSNGLRIFCKYESGASDNGIRYDWMNKSAFIPTKNVKLIDTGVRVNFNNLSNVKKLQYQNLTATVSAGNSFTSNNNIMLFCSSHSPGSSIVGWERFYYCKIYSGTTLVRDFIPVRKNGVGYMYDSVSGTLFGNDGTGSFGLGPDI